MGLKGERVAYMYVLSLKPKTLFERKRARSKSGLVIHQYHVKRIEVDPSISSQLHMMHGRHMSSLTLTVKIVLQSFSFDVKDATLKCIAALCPYQDSRLLSQT